MGRVLCFLWFLTWSLRADEVPVEEFNSEILSVDKNLVQVISSFDEVDYFSTYSPSGALIWEVPFGSKILSWKRGDGESLFIFSKNRNSLVTYLTCVDPSTGKIVWENSILSPKAAAGMQP